MRMDTVTTPDSNSPNQGRRTAASLAVRPLLDRVFVQAKGKVKSRLRDHVRLALAQGQAPEVIAEESVRLFQALSAEQRRFRRSITLLLCLALAAISFNIYHQFVVYQNETSAQSARSERLFAEANTLGQTAVDPRLCTQATLGRTDMSCSPVTGCDEPLKFARMCLESALQKDRPGALARLCSTPDGAVPPAQRQAEGIRLLLALTYCAKINPTLVKEGK
jgi:hypothetical protein